MRRLVPVLALVLALASGCGGSDPSGTTAGPAARDTTAQAATNPTPRPRSGDVLVAALGDSITAGSPLYDPDPQVRAQLGARLDPRSSFEYWYAQDHPRYRFRNCGVFGQRTDQIAERLDACAQGAKVLVVQGGINDIAQGRPVADAARDMRLMFEAGKQLGLDVVTVEVLPWNNGGPAATPLIRELNARIRSAAGAEHVPVMPWYAALRDPADPTRMRADLTIDGDHPSVAGYRVLASRLTLP